MFGFSGYLGYFTVALVMQWLYRVGCSGYKMQCNRLKLNNCHNGYTIHPEDDIGLIAVAI